MKPPFVSAVDFPDSVYESLSPESLLELRIHAPVSSCNLRCNYCLNEAPFGVEEGGGSRLELDELEAVISQGKALGARTITITGKGEPLLYDRIRELVDHIRHEDMNAFIYTNGLLLDTDLCRFFLERDVSLKLKLNSLRAEIEDGIVGVPGAHAIFMEKLALLESLGFTAKNLLSIHCVIANWNFEEIPDLFRFCRRNGIIPWIERLTITGRARQSEDPGENELEGLYRMIAEIDREEFSYSWQPDSAVFCADRRRYDHICQVDLEGWVYCTDTQKTKTVGNIRNAPLAEILASEAFRRLRRSDKHVKDYLGRDIARETAIS